MEEKVDSAMEFNYMIIGFLIIYFLILLFTGLLASKNTSSIEDFFLGGRKLDSLMLSTSVSSTGMSGWLALGFAGYTYENGFQSLWIMVPSATIGILLCYVLISKRIRLYSEQTASITIIEVIKKRFYDDNNTLTIVFSLVLSAASIIYISAQLIAIGKLLNILLDWNYSSSILIAIIIMIFYTVLGGFTAVCWTDFIQCGLMAAGSFIAGSLAIQYAGGLGSLSQKVVETNQMFPEFAVTPFSSFDAIILGISLFIGDGILNWVGQPTLMVRYMAAKDIKTLKSAPLITITIQCILFMGIFIAAIYMRTQFPEPTLFPYGGDTETVLIQFFITMAHPMLTGIFVSSILAAVMSTSDSLFMMATSVLVNDIYNYLRPRSSQKHLIFISRLVTILLGIIAFIISMNESSVLWSSWLGWTTLGIMGMPVIIGLYWARATKEGAIWGLLSGFTVLVFWNIFDLTEKLNIFHALPSCGIAFIVTILISLFTSKPPDHIAEDLKSISTHSGKKRNVEVFEVK